MSVPVEASRAATVPAPVLTNSIPPTISGVFCELFGMESPGYICRTASGMIDCRQAIRRSFTLSRLIWSSAEYLVLPLSPA
jgi:hypothetical protein